MSVIQVRNAYKQYKSTGDTKKVLNGFNMTVEQGTIYAMMGASGCGKTTLLSCLVGINSLDKGEVEILGEPLHKVNKTRIGYMPQESALILGMTIKEMIWFFGTIFGMKSEIINERFRLLSSILELPEGSRLIRNCSGGQQRRISLAVSLVQEPEILILDEPTVGIDPILKSKIWSFFEELTTKQNVTILISTHHLDEAKDSQRIGLLRNGVQVAEDSPQNILTLCEANNLEDAFLRLSEEQDREMKSSNRLPGTESFDNVMRNDFDSQTMPLKKPFYDPNRTRPKQKFSKIISSLLLKQLVEVLRDIDVFVMIMLIPLIGCVTLHFGIGGRIEGFKLGIVNDEVGDISECFNTSLVTTHIRDDYECDLNKISCRFITGFNQSFAELEYFKVYNDAYTKTHQGKLNGFIYFPSNFTSSFIYFNDDPIDVKDDSDFGVIQVRLDQTDNQKTNMMRKELYDSFRNFTEHLMMDCGKTRKAANWPMNFEAMFGELNFDLKFTFIPAFILSAFFSGSSFLTSLSIISERSDGIWHRVQAAGVLPNHFVISHLIEGFVIMCIQLLEYFLYTNFFLSTSLSFNSRALIFLLLFLDGLTGVTFGLFISITTQTVMSSIIVSQMFAYPTSFISGVMWPLQALPTVLRYVGYIFPFAWPITAFRSIIGKDIPFHHHEVIMSLIVTLSWISVATILSFIFINKKK